MSLRAVKAPGGTISELLAHNTIGPFPCILSVLSLPAQAAYYVLRHKLRVVGRAAWISHMRPGLSIPPATVVISITQNQVRFDAPHILCKMERRKKERKKEPDRVEVIMECAMARPNEHQSVSREPHTTLQVYHHGGLGGLKPPAASNDVAPRRRLSHFKRQASTPPHARPSIHVS